MSSDDHTDGRGLKCLDDNDLCHDRMSSDDQTDGRGLKCLDETDICHGRMSSDDHTDGRGLKYQISHCQSQDARSTLCADSPMLTPVSNAVEGLVVTGNDGVSDDRADVLDDEVMSAEYSESVNAAELLSSEKSRVNSTTEALTNNNTDASDVADNDDTDSTCLMSEVSCYQHPEALRDAISDSTLIAVDADRSNDNGLSEDDRQWAVDHTGSENADGLLKSNIGASDDGKPATDRSASGEFEAKVSDDQLPNVSSVDEYSGQVESTSLDVDGRCGDEGLPQSAIDASDDGKPAADLTESREFEAEAKVSDDRIPDASDVDADSGQVKSKTVDDVPCNCALQCPYCFFAIASVRLLRQHMVFHVAMSDAANSPVFHTHLDTVEDGRMDDVRCEHLVRLCNQCRHLAELENPIVIPETADSLVGFGNHDVISRLQNAGQVTVSELADKTAFLFQLRLLHVP